MANSFSSPAAPPVPVRKVSVDGNFIEISEGDQRLYRVRTRTVADQYFGDQAMRFSEFGLLPAGVRWISADRRSFLIEEPADIRLVCLAMPGRFIPLPFPTMVAMVTFSDNYTSVVKLKVGWSRSSVQTLGEVLVPLPNMDGLEMNMPVTIPAITKFSDIGRYLGQIFEHLHAVLYQVWAGQRLNLKRLPLEFMSGLDLDKTYPHAQFLAWWAEQPMDSVIDWNYAHHIDFNVKELIAELEHTDHYGHSWDFFCSLAERAKVVDQEMMVRRAQFLRNDIARRVEHRQQRTLRLAQVEELVAWSSAVRARRAEFGQQALPVEETEGYGLSSRRIIPPLAPHLQGPAQHMTFVTGTNTTFAGAGTANAAWINNHPVDGYNPVQDDETDVGYYDEELLSAEEEEMF